MIKQFGGQLVHILNLASKTRHRDHRTINEDTSNIHRQVSFTEPKLAPLHPSKYYLHVHHVTKSCVNCSHLAAEIKTVIR